MKLKYHLVVVDKLLLFRWSYVEDNIFISRTLKVHNLMTKNTDDPITFFMKIKFMKEILLCTKLVQWRNSLCCLFKGDTSYKIPKQNNCTV